MKYALCILFFSGAVYAADFAPNTQLEILSDFSGGLNTAAPAHKLQKNFSPNMRNVFTHRQPGKLVKRNGFAFVGSTNTLRDGRTGFTFYHTDGSKDFLVSDSSMLLSTKDYQTYVLVSSGLNPSAMLQFGQINNKVYVTNGVDPVFSWDGTSKVIYNGSNGTPNIPKFKYICAYQNRLFGANTSADNASLDWSAVLSTNGAILTPDNYLAWPAANHKSIGATDGESLNALWIQRGQLQMGKDRSIWILFGNSDASYLERKIESQAGVSSQDSVVLLDGVAYYKGADGIYAYDTNVSQRISDLIKPDVDAMEDPSSKILQNAWETKADFLRGQFLHTSTVTDNGFVRPFFGDRNIANDPGFATNPSGAQLTRLTNGSPSAGFTVFTPTVTLEANEFFNLKFWRVWYLPSGDSTTEPRIGWAIKNTRTNEISSFTIVAGNSAQTVDFQRPSQNSGLFVNGSMFNSTITFLGSDFNSGNVQMKINLQNVMTRDYVDVSFTDVAGSSLTLMAQTTGQYMSEVSTLTSVTAWGSFNSVNASNGNILSFYIRSATSAVNITTQTWKTITSGVIIDQPTQNNFVQWASTMASVLPSTAVTAENSPTIDNVTIDHIEGGAATNRTVAIAWNNEYWLSVSTSLGSSLRLQYVKSWTTNANPNSWNVLSGLNMGSLFKDGSSTLYGGSTSTGVFFRLDYGTNDNGSAIDAFYETPELVLRGALGGGQEGNWMEEQLREYWIDADAETGNTFRLGTSLNGGTYTENLVSLAGGPGRALKILYNVQPFAKYFRWRFRNSDLDKGLNLNAFGVVYTPQRTR